MSRALQAFCSLPALLAIAACASGSDRYPSLAVRPAERVGGTFAAPSPVPEPSAPGQAATTRIDSLVTSANAAHRRFLDRVESARTLALAGRGAGPEDNRWAAAQIALADLDSIRSDTAIALGDLDLMFVDTTLSNIRREQVEQARAAVVSLIAEQDRILSGLRQEAGQ